LTVPLLHPLPASASSPGPVSSAAADPLLDDPGPLDEELPPDDAVPLDDVLAPPATPLLPPDPPLELLDEPPFAPIVPSIPDDDPTPGETLCGGVVDGELQPPQRAAPKTANRPTYGKGAR